MRLKTYKCSFCKRPIRRPAGISKRHFCNNNCKGEYQKLARPVTRKWLVEHYITKQMNCTQIAEIVNRDSKSVWNWLKDFDIPTRPRGHNIDQLPKDGSQFRGKHHTPEFRQAMSIMSKATGRMPFKAENGPPQRGKKGAETSNWKGGLTPERQAFYSSPEWAKAVKAVWHRADAKCERCSLDHRTIDRTKKRFHVHHIVSFQVRELRAVVSNLALLCDTCHRWVHGKGNKNHEFIGQDN